MSLWKSDGTANGIQEFFHLPTSGVSTVDLETLSSITTALFPSDGTVNGTITADMAVQVAMYRISAIGNGLLNADDGMPGWTCRLRPAGTVNGTAMVKDINNDDGSTWG